VADSPDRGELLTALTTEHFTLQGARSQTMSESSSRAALFIGAVSSTLVALGFLGQLSPGGDTFNTFALTVLPTLYLLGVFTFVRLVECGAEDFRYGLAINRIRGYYKQLAGDEANLFLPAARRTPGVSSSAASPAPASSAGPDTHRASWRPSTNGDAWAGSAKRANGRSRYRALPRSDS
jgi:hypothetical protein